MKNKKSQRKLCGYLGCMVILGTLIESEIPTFSPDDPETTYLPKIVTKEIDTVQNTRLYFIDDNPIHVDTSKEGWIVELMWNAQKKKTKE